MADWPAVLTGWLAGRWPVGTGAAQQLALHGGCGRRVASTGGFDWRHSSL